ncbi:sensor histidine kinase [Saccharicrinis aurantiacus]|uniref:sensor histidine kinase n=1 Tax=Saccharicrinis aurantiacus TaxID=1849719 RepID=UPI00249226B9|nr:ATP-binding protein [Saccharicrinis aurantiacus]
MSLSSMIDKIKSIHVLFVVSVLLSIIFASIYKHNTDGAFNLRSFRTTLIEKKHEAQEYSTGVLKALDKETPWKLVEKSLNDKPEGYDFLIYENDSLVAWSDQMLSYNNEGIQQFDQQVVKLENEWAWVHVYKHHKQKVISIISLRKEYPYNNAFLHDAYTIASPFNDDCKLITKQIEGQLQVTDEDGTFLFSIENCQKENAIYAYISIMFFIICLLIYFSVIINELKKAKSNKVKWIIFYGSTLFIFILYAAHSYLNWPGILFETALFSPIHFGVNRFLSNLGSLLFFAILVYMHALLFYRYIDLGSSSFGGKILWRKYLMLVFNIVIGVAIWFVANHIIIEMFDHSPVATLVFKVTDIQVYGVVRIFITALLWLSSVLVLEKMLRSFYLHFTKRLQLIVLCVVVAISLLFCHNLLHYIIQVGVILLYMLLLWIKQNPNRHAYTSFIWFIFFFAAYAVVVFLIHYVDKENEERRLLIDNLSFRLILEEDPLSELLLKEKEQLINKDTFLLQELTKPNMDVRQIQRHLSKVYFDGYLSRYDLQLIPCWPGGEVRLTQTDSLYDCYSYFKGILKNHGTKVLGSNNYYFMSSPVDVITYFGVFTFYANSDQEVTLFLELVAKPFFEGAGYPELLLTERERKLKEPFTHYSYGKYVNQELVKQTGDFSYSKEVFSKGSELENYGTFRYKGFDHMVYHPEDDVTIILSLPVIDFNMLLVAFSSFFIFYFVFGSILVSIIKVKKGQLFRNFSIHERIQVSIISLMFLLLIAIAGGSVWQSLNRFEEKNHQILSEKTKSILMELEHKIGSKVDITEEDEAYLTSLLTKFSNVFYTDINMYSLEGRLMATSRPELYEKGLQSHLMNSAGFLAMRNNLENEFIQYEKIGDLEFLSAYVPFFNNKNEIMAYINMPYFIGTSEIREEVSSLVMGILNFYLIFLIIVFALTVVISRRITYPLLVVQDKMSRLQLGVRNEKIEYKWNDEIGKLVTEYNRMVDELASSAENLAKSQRELAWREMAQQIAHEIKNPLTPMKLSIQYLELARQDDADDFDMKLKRVSSTLIDQIDKLSSIASEFSNFAKMPAAQREQINIIESLLQCVHLFDKEEKVVFRVINRVGGEYLVYADPKQLISVFNNLIKNAMQAIPDKQDGLIEVHIEDVDDNIVIRVKDNGRGIPDEIKDKLFMPNFTTKSSGMGLGLAIVKNMVNINKGEIWFETELNVGSTFSVKFPKNDLLS